MFAILFSGQNLEMPELEERNYYVVDKDGNVLDPKS